MNIYVDGSSEIVWDTNSFYKVVLLDKVLHSCLIPTIVVRFGGLLVFHFIIEF